MKKKIVRWIVWICLVCMLLVSCKDEVSNESKDGKDTYAATVWTDLIANGSSEYRIVVSKKNEKLYSMAYDLAIAIREKTGVTLAVVYDTYDPQPYEILVGETNRSESIAKMSEMQTPDDYWLGMVGQKMVLYCHSNEGAEGVIAAFTQDVLSTAMKGKLFVDSNLSQWGRSSKNYLPLIVNGNSEYSIVCQSEQKEDAQRLQKTIQQATGVILPIAENSKETAKEILLGAMGRSEGIKANEMLASGFEFGISVSGSKVILLGTNDAAISDAVTLFESHINDYVFKEKTMMMGTDYSLSNSFEKDQARDYIESITCVPESQKILSAETSRIFTPEGEDGWYYSHHPYITKFNNRFYAFYSSGRVNEDDCGQRIMMAVSDDFQHWENRVLVDSIMGESSEWVLYCKGYYIYDGKLTVFFQGYEYYESDLRYNEDGTPLRPAGYESIQRGTFYVQTSDGQTWSEYKKLEGTSIWGGNLSPELLASQDRLFWSGYGNLSYSDDLSGTGLWKNVPLTLADGIARPKDITESGFYQLPDGTILLFSRTDDKVLLCAASFDGGATWTDMYQTKFQDNSAKFKFGTLSDGRYYFLGNFSYKREEIVLITSEDGITFNNWYYLADGTDYTQLKAGLYKGGTYGYPNNYIDGEYMYVIYSMYKESIEVLRVKLSDLGL